MLPFTDGGTGLSLVISHGLTDGVGLTTGARRRRLRPLTIRSAGRPPDHDAGGAALRQDARQTVRDTPAVGRAIAAGARMARQCPPGGQRAAASRVRTILELRTNRSTSRPRLSSSTCDEWDARAQSLGGTSNSLLAGFAAKFAQRVGRVTAGDGMATLAMPVNDRFDGDTRANAVRNADVTVDPTNVTTDLAGGPRRRQSSPHPGHRRSPTNDSPCYRSSPSCRNGSSRRMVSVAAGNARRVSCSSNLGDVAARRPVGRTAPTPTTSRCARCIPA